MSRSSRSRAQPPRLEASVPGTSNLSPHSGPTILLIDDDDAVRESLRRALTTEGWRVVASKSGEEALERLSEGEPALMITDLRMKPVDGWDLVFHETILRPHMPIFIVTALSREAAREAAGLAAEFFQKPVDLDVLLAAIRFHLEAGCPPVHGRHQPFSRVP